MLCNEAREHLSAYVDKELTAELSAAIRDHVASCAECRALVEDLRATADLLGRLPVLPAPRHLAADVQREIERRLILEAPQTAPGQAPERTVPMHRARQWPRAVALAATLLLATGIGILGYLNRTPMPVTVYHTEHVAKAPAKEEAGGPDLDKSVATADATAPAATAPLPLEPAAPAAPAGPVATPAPVVTLADAENKAKEGPYSFAHSSGLAHGGEETNSRNMAENEKTLAMGDDRDVLERLRDVDGDTRGAMEQEDLSGKPAIPGNGPVAKASPSALAYSDGIVMHDDAFRLAGTSGYAINMNVAPSTSLTQLGSGFLSLHNGDVASQVTAGNWDFSIGSGATVQPGPNIAMPSAPLVLGGDGTTVLDKRLAFTLTPDNLPPEEAKKLSDLRLNKAGAGTMTLSGVNTYTGAMTINGGVLTLAGTLAAGDGAWKLAQKAAKDKEAETGSVLDSYSGSTNISNGTLALKDEKAGSGEDALKIANSSSLGEKAEQNSGTLVLTSTAGSSYKGGALGRNGADQEVNNLALAPEKGREAGAKVSGETFDLGGANQSVGSVALGNYDLNGYAETRDYTDKGFAQKLGAAPTGGMGGGGGGRGGGQLEEAVASTKSRGTRQNGVGEQFGAVNFSGTISGTGGVTKFDTGSTATLGAVVVTKPGAAGAAKATGGNAILSTNDISKAGPGDKTATVSGLTLSGGTITNANAGGTITAGSALTMNSTITGLSGTGAVALNQASQSPVAPATVAAQGKSGPAPADHFGTEGKVAFAPSATPPAPAAALPAEAPMQVAAAMPAVVAPTDVPARTDGAERVDILRQVMKQSVNKESDGKNLDAMANYELVLNAASGTEAMTALSDLFAANGWQPASIDDVAGDISAGRRQEYRKAAPTSEAAKASGSYVLISRTAGGTTLAVVTDRDSLSRFVTQVAQSNAVTVAPGSSHEFARVAETQTILRTQERLAAENNKPAADHGIEVAAASRGPAAPKVPAPLPPPASAATAAPKREVAPAKTPSAPALADLQNSLTWSSPSATPASRPETATKSQPEAFEKPAAAQPLATGRDMVLLVIHIQAAPTMAHEGAAADQTAPSAATETGK